MQKDFDLDAALLEAEENTVNGEADSTRQFQCVDIHEMLSMDFPPREHILSPWLPTQGLTMLYASRGMGKTYVGLGIAVAVASGGSIFRWSAPKARGVLYLDGEMPAVTMQERLAGIVASNEKEPSAPLKIITPDLQKHSTPDLSSPQDQAIIDAHIDGVSLIIADNISTLCRTGRENDGEGWQAVQAWALRMRKRGVAVLFIHHAGKTGAQRGTSKREDVLDTVIVLKRPGDYRPDEGARFEVHFEKNRGIYGDEVKPFEAMLTSSEPHKLEWVIKDLEASLMERVATLLMQGIPQHEIPEMLGISKGYVSKLKKQAASAGLLS